MQKSLESRFWVVTIIMFYGSIRGILRWDWEQSSASKDFERTIAHRRISKMKTTQRVIAVICVYFSVAALIFLIANSVFDLSENFDLEAWRTYGFIYIGIPTLYLFSEAICGQIRLRAYEKRKKEAKMKKKK